MTGAIPPALGELANLSWLSLHNNRLTGAIPAELGNLGRLYALSLDSNELTGPIPPELGQLTDLVHLDLAFNRLTGRISPSLGMLANLRSLDLSANDLTGSIPAELGRLTGLSSLRLGANRLSGPLPRELGNLSNLRVLALHYNRLTGTLPWGLREAVAQGDLWIRVDANAIGGFEPPPPGARPAFPADAVENGNASHHSVAYYQGPLVWSWNWQDEPVQHQRPILGRWAVLAVRIEHETAQPPPVIARVLDSDDEVLAERLAEAAPPSTEFTGPGQWHTEYVFELPGSLFAAGNRLVPVIDPDGEMAETDEDDNVGEPVVLYGETPPRFRVTFVPLVHVSDGETPFMDATALMAGTRALWPIADDFEAVVRSPLITDAEDIANLSTEIRALWNAEADADEFYHGIYVPPWPGEAERSRRVGGIASQGGRTAVSENSTHDVIPHEFGHNLSLLHTPGCGALWFDRNYPYRNGGLGRAPGWDVNWRHFVSGEDDAHTDIMSGCGSGPSFVSDYHYRKALTYWLSTAQTLGSAASSAVSRTGAASGPGTGSTHLPAVEAEPTGVPSGSTGGLALSGAVDASGAWRLTHSQSTEKGPRAPSPDGDFTLILFDAEGVELYREPLSAMRLSHGGESGWAARTPRPVRSAREVAILNARGVAVLRQALPAPD